MTWKLSVRDALNLSGIGPTFKYSTAKTPKSTETFYGYSNIEKRKSHKLWTQNRLPTHYNGSI